MSETTGAAELQSSTPQAANTPAEENQEINKLISRHDYYRNFTFTSRKTVKPKRARNSQKVIDVRRYIDSKGRLSRTLYLILATPLRELFLEIHRKQEDLDLSRVNSELLYFSYKPLQQRLKVEQVKEDPDQELCHQIQAALAVTEQDLSNEFIDIENFMNAGKIRFDLLWALFPHRGLVYSYDSMVGQHAIYRVLSTETIEDEQKKLWFVLNCHVLKHDGMHFGLSIVKLDIEQFTGLVQIRNLTVYPLDLHPDKDILYQDAVALGRKIANMGSHVCYEYSSHAIRDQQFQSPRYRTVHDRRDDRIERFYSSSRVMISPSAFRRYLPDSAYNPRVFRALDASEVIEDDYAIICPIMLGFSLGMKCWGGFAMSHLREVEWNDSAFDSLVLGEKQKKLIRGLVFQHSLPENDLFDDVIKNKGRGLIGLLAGTPGCGKTLTAEAVAEIARRPLYSISTGELGVDPSHIEENLIRALELAHMWNAVILIDEAEVFLHQRIPAELQRNAAVAIFLRQLEYYQGMMILTTNMVEACDVALESRIHFLVHYPELDTAARRKIWAMFASRAALTISDHELERLAAYAMNGRQIKNVFRSAQTLSLSNGSGKLNLDDVQIVIGVLQDWKEGAAAKMNRVH